MQLLKVLMLSFAFVLQLLYTKAGKDNLKNYGVIMDTPVYVTAVQSGINASDVSHCPWFLHPSSSLDLLLFSAVRSN